MARTALITVAIGMAAAPAPSARADARIVTDQTFFDRIPHVFLDFETRGDGTPWNLDDTEAFVSLGDEYLPQGILLGGAAYLFGNPPPSDLNDALAAVGTPDVLMGIDPNTSNSTPTIAFSRDFGNLGRSFGFAFIRNTALDSALTLTLVDEQEQVLASFTQDDFLTLGQVGDFEYGLAWMTSDTPFRGVIFSSNNFDGLFFDDLRFSRVPAPGGTALSACAGLMATRRRRAPATMRTVNQECL